MLQSPIKCSLNQIINSIVSSDHFIPGVCFLFIPLRTKFVDYESCHDKYHRKVVQKCKSPGCCHCAGGVKIYYKLYALR